MINGDRDSILITVTNESSELISVGSHFHFVEANRHLSFDRTLAYGMRLVNRQKFFISIMSLFVFVISIEYSRWRYLNI